MIRKIGTFFGLLLGTGIALFGVFIFNFLEPFSYQNRDLSAILFEIGQNPFVGLYEFSWMGFKFNIFNFIFEFPTEPEKMQYLIEEFLPVFLAWFSSGLITGLLVVGIKRGLLFSFIVVAFFIILWLSFGVITGANITFVFIENIFETGGCILTALLSILIGGLIGGAISSTIFNKIEIKKAVKEMPLN